MKHPKIVLGGLSGILALFACGVANVSLVQAASTYPSFQQVLNPSTVAAFTKLEEKGVFNIPSSGSNAMITRKEFVIMLAYALHLNQGSIKAAGGPSYSDLSGPGMAAYIDAAKKAGLIQGNIKASATPSYSDPSGPWAAAYIDAAKKAGLIQDSNQVYQPYQKLSMNEIQAVLARLSMDLSLKLNASFQSASTVQQAMAAFMASSSKSNGLTVMGQTWVQGNRIVQIQLGGRTITKTVGYMDNNQLYLPMWYLNEVLKKLGISAVWDGTKHVLSITAPNTIPVDTSFVGYLGNPTTIKINGVTVDSAATEIRTLNGSSSTYVSVKVLDSVLRDLGINANWSVDDTSVNIVPQLVIHGPSGIVQPGQASRLQLMWTNGPSRAVPVGPVTWSVNESGATISAAGRFEAAKEGTYTVTGTWNGIPTTTTLTVDQPVISFTDGLPVVGYLNGRKETAQLTVHVKDTAGKPLANMAVQFVSSDPSLVTVGASATTDATGSCTITVEPGTNSGWATVTATVNGASATKHVYDKGAIHRVKPAAPSLHLSVSKDEPTNAMPLHSSFVVSVTNSNGHAVANQAVTFTLFGSPNGAAQLTGSATPTPGTTVTVTSDVYGNAGVAVVEPGSALQTFTGHIQASAGGASVNSRTFTFIPS